MKYSSSQSNGYSLIEMIVYLAVFTTLSILIINCFIVISASFSQTRTNRDLLEAGSSSLERISREIRQSKNIDIANSTLGSSPGVLSLSSTDASSVDQTIKFAVVGGALNIYKNGTLIGNLLGQNISVTSLIFRRIATTNGEAVKIELSVQDTRSKNLTTKNFYDTIILRNEY
jgi:Tfp pilus assembly protein FimT